MNRWMLYLWIGSYAVIWSTVTLFLDPVVPYDAIESLNWAQNVSWGAPKNPWLVGMSWWPALLISPFYFCAYWYGTHFLAISAGMAGTWYLTRALSGSDRLAWLALLTLNLSGIINFDIISYNDNYLLVMLWPWMMLCLFNAISRHSVWWLAFATTASLACMAKYTTFSIIVSVLISTLIIPSVRKCYRQPFFYLAIFLAILIVMPNIVWLIKNDFVAVGWFKSQVSCGFNHFLMIKLLSIFYPLIFLIYFLMRCNFRFCVPSHFGKKAVALTIVLPILTISIWAFFHNGGRLTEWLQPFFILAPALITGCFIQGDTLKVSRVYPVLLGAALFVLLGYIIVMTTNLGNVGKKMSGIISFSITAEQIWNERYGVPLLLVGGEHLAE